MVENPIEIEESAAPQSPNRSVLAKNSARYAFVQAIYEQRHGTQITSAERWVEEYLARHSEGAKAHDAIEEDAETGEFFALAQDTAADGQFLRRLLRYWLENRSHLIADLTTRLSTKKRAFERLATLMQATLLAGCSELQLFPQRKAVILKEYVEIAASYYDQPELGYLNGVLQEIADEITETATTPANSEELP